MCPQYRMWKPSRPPGTCLAQPARVSCLTAAMLNPSLSPQRYRDDVSVVVTPLTTRTAKQQCARSRACVEALGRVIIWPGLQRSSEWCIGWRADSFLQGTRSRETGPVSASAFSFKTGWKHSSYAVSLTQLASGSPLCL